MKPPLFADKLLEDLQRDLWEEKMNIQLPWQPKRPKNKFLIEFTQNHIDRLKREIFIESL